ncbi:MAG: hypothetical protein AAFO69_15110 [Bacteroidota bacterium]
MNIQPGSAAIRKYIPAETYFSMQEDQRHKSFIGLSLNSVAHNSIVARIKVLETLEKEGFVYVGEKNWLQCYLQNNHSSHFSSYNQWVTHNLENFLQLNLTLSSQYEKPIWWATLDCEQHGLGFSQLQNPSFLPPDDLELLIGGSEHFPHPAFMANSFEFLHNLEYAISTICYEVPERLSITGIEVSNEVNPSRWELNVISGYGSEWDFSIINGQAWKA